MKFNSDKIFSFFGFITTFFCLSILFLFIIYVLKEGLGRLNLDFITNLPSRFANKSGIYTSLVGTLWLIILTGIITIPVGLCTGIYLEEYRPNGIINKFIELNITNLAGVPSIIFGLLGLTFFGKFLGLGQSILTGSLTLTLLILPIMIVSTREAIKSVPKSIRLASYALGATKWQTIYKQVLPAALGNISTGIIISLSRAIGETAPLIVIGALAYVPFIPTSPLDKFSALPIQVYNWISRPQKEFLTNAAAGIIVLLFLTLTLNGLSIYLRIKNQKKYKW